MSRSTKVDHRSVAAALQQTPEVWRLVRAYPTRAAALSAAHAIKTGSYPAYRPCAGFDAEARRDADGEHVVWARYLGDPDTDGLEQAQRIAVALEQENARLQQVIGFLLTNPMQQMAIRAWTSDIDAMAGRVTLTDLGNRRTEIKYEWLQDFLAAPGGAS